MDEHCDRHCVRGNDHWGQCVGSLGEQWSRGCPRCAERERIVEAIEGEIRLEGRDMPLYRIDGLLRAIEIVRGEA